MATRLTTARPRMQRSRLQTAAEIKNKRTKSKRQLWVQIVVMSLLIVALCVVFLLVIFPFLIETSGQINSAKYVPEKNQIKPQTPLFNAPPAYTNQGVLKVTGFATPETKVQFVINDQELPEYLLEVGFNGEFNFSFQLKEGENSLLAYSLDSQGLISNETKKYYVVLDRETPELEIFTPETTEIVGKDKQLLTITGKTEPQAQVLTNTIQSYADDEGKFSLNYQLQTGENKLHFQVTDRANNQKDWEMTLTYRP